MCNVQKEESAIFGSRKKMPALILQGVFEKSVK